MYTKTIRIFVFLLVLSAATACVQTLEPIPGKLANGKYTLDLSVRSIQVDTKAGSAVDSLGIENLNENRLLHIDWFIFPTAAASDQSKPAVLHGRVSWTEGEHDNATSKFLAKSVRMDEYINLEGCGRTGYVFVIANLPDMYTHVPDEKADNSAVGGIQYTVAEETVTVNTLAGLKALALTTNFDNYHLTGGPSEYTTATFDPQESFVMKSELRWFEIADGATNVEVETPLERVAAKISLDISLATAIDEIKASMAGRDTTGVEYVQTWYPETDKIQIYLSYANKNSTVEGTPESYTSSRFFTYNRYSFKPSIDPANPVQSIYFDPSASGYYQHPLYHKVMGTPFYTYPLQWQTSDAHAPFIKIIIPWTAYKEDVTYKHEHRYINHNHEGTYHLGDTLLSVSRRRDPTTKVEGKENTEFYYKILIPSEDLKLLSNNWYKIKLDVAVLGSRSDDLSTILSGRYYVVDWGSPGFSAGGIFDQGRYLSVSDTLYTMNAIESIEIPVSSSHAIKTDLVRLDNNGAVINGSVGTGLRWRNRAWEIMTAATMTSRQCKTTDNGRTSFTFEDPLVATMGSNLDCYPMRFVVRIRHTDKIGTTEESAYTKYVAIIQYPSIYVDTKDGDNAFVNGYYAHMYISGGNTAYYRSTSGRGQSTTGNTTVSYGNMTQNNASAMPYMLVVNVSAFDDSDLSYTVNNNQSFPFLIADPRTGTIPASGLISYNTVYTTAATQTASWANNEAVVSAGGVIKVGDTSTSAPGRNYISPRFMICSLWGRNPGNANYGFTNSQKRCATYQEAGYPAGRWRLPTEAEVNFVAKLQANGIINEVFNDGTSYWVSNGTIVEVDGTTVSVTSGTGASMRCVYDLWYWGDDPIQPVYQYHIAP